MPPTCSEHIYFFLAVQRALEHLVMSEGHHWITHGAMLGESLHLIASVPSSVRCGFWMDGLQVAPSPPLISLQIYGGTEEQQSLSGNLDSLSCRE